MSVPEKPDRGGMSANDEEIRQLQEVLVPESDIFVHVDS
jgi:hypothetical protein